eukprot:6697311-Lingulodinium_polyedra.AAC.1
MFPNNAKQPFTRPKMWTLALSIAWGKNLMDSFAHNVLTTCTYFAHLMPLDIMKNCHPMHIPNKEML